MAPKKKQRQSQLGSFLPLLAKPAVALGRDVHVPGDFWEGCPAADKKKLYKCTVIEFHAMKDFGPSGKSAAYEVKEMGEQGTGSLEPGA